MIRSLSPATLSRISFLFFTFIFISVFSYSANSAETKTDKNLVNEYNLENGLKVLVKKDKRAPVRLSKFGIKLVRVMNTKVLLVFLMR